jgi:hypothetical protein
MDVDQLKNWTGSDLDDAGDKLGVTRVSPDSGHAFTETDDSFRRRLLAEVVGAEEADAVTPRESESMPAWAAGLDDQGRRTDGPTLDEWITAGYKAEFYPPHGYAPKGVPDAQAGAADAPKGQQIPVDIAGAPTPKTDALLKDLQAAGNETKPGKKEKGS